MKMMTSIFMVVIQLFVLHPLLSAGQCRCKVASEFPTKLSFTVLSPSVSPYDYVAANGTSYGHMVSLSNTKFLTADVPIIKSYLSLDTKCPPGFRAPTYEEMYRWMGLTVDFLVSPKGMNMNPGLYYATSRKANNVTKGSKVEAYDFIMLSIDPVTESPKFITVNTYEKLSVCVVKCVMNSSEALALKAPVFDLRMGTNQLFSNPEKNGVAYYWNFGDQTSTTKDFQYNPTVPGCISITAKVQLWNGDILENCVPAYVLRDFGNSSSLLITDGTEISSKVLVSNNVHRKTKFHFECNSAPIAPIPTGGAFILYTTNSTNTLTLLSVSPEFDVSSPVSLGIQGYPLDIIAVSSSSFVFLAIGNDTNKLFIERRVKSGSSSSWVKKWSIVIMNNGAKYPTKTVDQLYFFQSNKSYSAVPIPENQIVEGMVAMGYPHNGRIIIGRDRVGFIFAHYSNLRGEFHSGDTFISVDLETGNDIKLGWAWKTSHSLIQQSLYNGRNVIVATLSDHYLTENINFFTINPDSSKFFSSDIFPGVIPGEKGLSCGRLGGLIQLSENRYALTYARRGPCSSPRVTNNVNELGVLFFDDNLTSVSHKSVVESNDINIVKAAKLGKNILIGFVRTTPFSDSRDKLADYLRPAVDSMYVMVINQYGSVVTPPFPVQFSASANDDWRVEKSGTVMWTYINQTGSLHLYWTKGHLDPLGDFDDSGDANVASLHILLVILTSLIYLSTS